MGILYIVATPIGNLEDITIRAIKTLFSVDYIACEDTRRTGQLLKLLKDKYTSIIQIIEMANPKLISYYDEIEEKRVPEIIELLQYDKNVALVSDSGTPLISDPGYKLIQECIKRNIKIISVPGPSSVITALTSAGVPANNFLFLGYLPPKEHARKKILRELLSGAKNSKQIHPTVIFFETPHRLKEALTDMKEIFGDMEIVVTRELTKIHEEICRGPISTIVKTADMIKGEVVVLFNIPPA